MNGIDEFDASFVKNGPKIFGEMIMPEDIFKMPRMGKEEYDRLVEEQYVCRIAFQGEVRPYIAPFIYVFDGRYMYFLSTKYGKKVQHFRNNPLVSVEIEHYSSDLSSFSFVSLPGRLVEVEGPEEKRAVRVRFIRLILEKGLSSNVLSALGHHPDEPVQVLVEAENSSVWKLVGVRVRDIMGLKSHGQAER